MGSDQRRRAAGLSAPRRLAGRRAGAGTRRSDPKGKSVQLASFMASGRGSHGDVVELEIGGIGVLRNPIIAES